MIIAHYAIARPSVRRISETVQDRGALKMEDRKLEDRKKQDQ